MMYEISAVTDGGVGIADKIRWIKQFREEVGCGLREAKNLCDYIDARIQRGGKIVIDTKFQTQFAYLDNYPRIRQGYSIMARMVNRGFKSEDNELDQILNKIDAKILRNSKPSKSADVILKQTAITLIRGGHIKHAKGVLEILM
jgi:hypothetical protein